MALVYTYVKFVDPHLEKPMFLRVVTNGREHELSDSRAFATNFKTRLIAKKYMSAWEHLMFDQLNARDFVVEEMLRCQTLKNIGQTVPHYEKSEGQLWVKDISKPKM